MSRICTKCKRPDQQFYAGKSCWCASCHKASVTARRQSKLEELKQNEKSRRDSLNSLGLCHRHPLRVAVKVGRCSQCREDYRASSKERLFGISIEEYDRKMQVKNCFVCRSEKRLGLDHCHKTKRIREVLCSNCNMAIGLLADNPQRLRDLANYLEERQ